jgi:hypothetical protein
MIRFMEKTIQIFQQSLTNIKTMPGIDAFDFAVESLTAAKWIIVVIAFGILAASI